MKKQIFTMTALGIISFLLAGCGNSAKTTSETEKSNVTSNGTGTVVADAADSPAAMEQDTDDDNDMNTQNMVSVEDLEAGKYRVTNEGRAVVVAHNDGNCLSTTSYNYKDDVLDSITVICKYSTSEKAKAAYESVKSNKLSSEKYSDIVLDGEKIKMTVIKSEVDGLKSLTKQELYEKQSAAYSNSESQSQSKKSN